LDDGALEQLGIDPGARAETLTMEAFIALAQVMPPSPASD
jgi:16S rRNA A1518/A1519 N6-dimethyltransferase RsmA/KsgA/DIM1 with predicted DNA glycosylase/AP lyase activity